MSEFHIQAVTIGNVSKHPNADALEITNVLGEYPVILRSGQFKPGDVAIYVPVDALVPVSDPRFAFLAGGKVYKTATGDSARIRAKRLRGIFSMGLLVEVGDLDPASDLVAALGIEKWEPEIDRVSTNGEDETDPGFLPCYTDLEGMRRWPDLIAEGEEVVLTEKIHGCNARFLWNNDRLWAGSRTRIKREAANTLWWKVAAQYQLAEKLASVPGIAVYGEIFGNVQDLRYDTKAGELRLALFDAQDITKRRYLDHDDFLQLAAQLGLSVVPELYRGPWSNDLKAMSNGKSSIASHCREGFVVKPIKERFDERVGRVSLKYVGEDYLTRKGG